MLSDPGDDHELQQARDAVTQHVLFRSLDEDALRQVLSDAKLIRFERNATIFAEGDVGDSMFLLVAGEVSVQTRGAGGDLLLAELGPGALVGEVSVLTGEVRTATVITRSDVRCVGFFRKPLLSVLEAHPKTLARLQALIEGRAKDAANKILES